MTDNKVVYSLIVTLCNEEHANLYNEIYFPIIEYVLATECVNKNGEKVEMSYEDLKYVLIDKFKLSIPQRVLKQVILRINPKALKIVAKTTDDKFTISSDWNGESDDNIQIRLAQNESAFDELENQFQTYLANDANEECGYTLLDFYSKNTLELLEYINSDSERQQLTITNSCIHAINFLVKLQKKNPSLYQFANNYFWASCIAAYLQRDDADLNLKPKERIQYYLDSKLLLSILGLDIEENCDYIKEIVESIVKSGNVPKVSGMTMYEVCHILDQVIESDCPDPSTSIGQTIRSGKVSVTDVVSIRAHLKELLEQKHKLVVDPCEPSLVDRLISETKGNPYVVQLWKNRKRQSLMYSDNEESNEEIGLESETERKYSEIEAIEPQDELNPVDDEEIESDDDEFSDELSQFSPVGQYWYKYFREIHDVYVMNFVQRISDRANSKQKIPAYFVTFNLDLIDFAKSKYKGQANTLISPSKVHTELWLHASKAGTIQKGQLTEAISRCLALNKTDALTKINSLAKHMLKLPQEDMASIFSAVLNQAPKALKALDKINDARFHKNKEQEEFAFVELQVVAKERETRMGENYRNALLKNEDLRKSVDMLIQGQASLQASLENQKKENDKNNAVLIAKIEEKKRGIEQLESQKAIAEAENQQLRSTIEKMKSDNETRKREDYIDKRINDWRRDAWVYGILVLFFSILVMYILCVKFSVNWYSFLPLLINFIFGKLIYDRYDSQKTVARRTLYSTEYDQIE